MEQWILWLAQRAKMIFAAVAPITAVAVLKIFEAITKIDIPAEQEVSILVWLTGILGAISVERVSNNTQKVGQPPVITEPHPVTVVTT